jgi:hypothetical protein
MIINQLIQVYCFSQGILFLVTTLIQLTNFIYADFLLNMKFLGFFTFILFWILKQWIMYQTWMVYASIFLAIFLAVYFYDGICNISENMIKRESKNIIGMVLIIVDLVLMAILYFIRK